MTSISHVFYILYVINLPKCQKTSFNFETFTSGPTTIHNFTIFRDIIITQKFQPWFLAMFCLASPSYNTIMYNVYYEGKKQQNTFKAREEKNYRKYITMLISSQLLLLWKMDGTMCNKNQAPKIFWILELWQQLAAAVIIPIIHDFPLFVDMWAFSAFHSLQMITTDTF